MPELRFNTYYRYEPLVAILKEIAAAHPNLVRLDSIGRSHEGRDIWLATVTRFDTGPDTEKPALWIDGNIHASEVSAASACLYFLQYLVNGYGQNDEVTRCLDSRVYYICPRINPDGAEWALADRPKIIRSSTRPYPYDEDPIGGLVTEDIDGDGRMLQMRVADPNGPWKCCPEDPRLLVRRDPTEVGGQYYRLLPEGRLEDYDGVTFQIQPKKERLDLNRNFPAFWRQEFEQGGAGPYPASEPEVAAVVSFIAHHPNLSGAITFHTFSGVLLRPYSDRNDESFPAEDLWTFQKIGEKGTEITGYPNISVYHDFRYHPKQVITGGFDDWTYDHLGLYSWCVEIWSPQRQAGIAEYKFIDWYREHSLEDDRKMLAWSDTVLNRQGYVDWYEFDHPQLGKVELGGWNALYAFRNPPPHLLESELALFPSWLLWHLLISPRLELFEASCQSLGEGAFRIRLVVHNTGWLPSYVSKKALEKKVTREVVCEIELPDGVTLETGKRREEIGHLEGRAYTPSSNTGGGGDATHDRAKVEWVVRGSAGTAIKVLARHDRAGTVRATVTLG